MLAASYREVGSEVLIVSATIEDEDYRTALLAAAGAEEHLLVLLEADPETMRERILDREPPGWSGLPDLLNASRSLAESMRLLDGVDVTISTEDRQPIRRRGRDRAGLPHRLGDLNSSRDGTDRSR